MEPKAFKFELGAKVQLVPSGEKGIVVGRAEYVNSGDTYHTRYVNAHGVLVESWWPEDALEQVRVD